MPLLILFVRIFKRLFTTFNVDNYIAAFRAVNIFRCRILKFFNNVGGNADKSDISFAIFSSKQPLRAEHKICFINYGAKHAILYYVLYHHLLNFEILYFVNKNALGNERVIKAFII